MATIKQQRAFKKVYEENKSPTKAMKEVGYTEATTNNPKILTESDGWQELLKDQLPDKTLTKVHKQGLKAKKNELDEYGKPVVDYGIRHKYLETAYKLKNRFEENVNKDLDFRMIVEKYKKADS